MIKTLVITDNIQFLSELVNYSTISHLNIHLSAIALDIDEAYNTFNLNNYDVIFIEKKLFNNKNQNLLDEWKEKLISISIKKIPTIKQLEIIKALSLNPDNVDFSAVRKNIIKELEYLGFNFKYKGTQYLIDTILQLSLTKSSSSDNLQGQIYPIIAKNHKRTPQNIKNSIINATEYMYRECNAEKLRKYFSFSNDAKPSVKQVIFTITNKIS